MKFMHSSQKLCPVFHSYQIHSSSHIQTQSKRRNNRRSNNFKFYFSRFNPPQNLLCVLNIHQVFHYFSSCFHQNRKFIRNFLYCSIQKLARNLLLSRTFLPPPVAP